MLKTNSRIVEFMSYTFPTVTLLALANILTHPNLFWGASRLSTQALDPLEFGSLSLTFGILSLITIKLHKSNSKLLVLYKLIGFFTGIYLSLASGSRTGWMALPIIGFLWLYFERAKFTYPTRLISALSFVAIIIFSYLFSTTVQLRTDAAVSEITNYHWNSPNPDTSVGARISFIRMAIFLLEKKPLTGWGDGNFESVINDPALNFAIIETKTVALKAGFHNDITANMVRSGIWGLIATMALLLIPALFFIRSLRSNNKNKRDLAFIALVFLICQFVSSLSMEIFTLKYSASFYGLMMAIFCGQILYYSNQDTLNPNSKIL
jgi:O-antigen ligase